MGVRSKILLSWLKDLLELGEKKIQFELGSKNRNENLCTVYRQGRAIYRVQKMLCPVSFSYRFNVTPLPQTETVD